MEIELTGHGGVDVANMSMFQTEAEVLLMTGTQLQVEKGLYSDSSKRDNDGQPMNVVKLKETGNPSNKYTGDEDSEISDPLSNTGKSSPPPVISNLEFYDDDEIGTSGGSETEKTETKTGTSPQVDIFPKHDDTPYDFLYFSIAS
jgi:hypothetical protein